MKEMYLQNINKKNIIAIFSVAIVAVALLTALIMRPGVVSAAACVAPSTDYGTITATVNIPTTGTHYIWSRMWAPDSSNNSYLLEVDGNTCYTVGDGNISPTTWSWVNFQNGNTGSRISQNLTAGNHTIKMIGREAGVRLDRLIFTTDAGCTPTGNGDNCAVAVDTTAPSVSVTAPAGNATISGSTTLSATASDNVAVTKVEFYVDSQLVGSDDTGSPYQIAWASTGIANGSHAITAKAIDEAGNTRTSSTVTVTVNNVVTPPPDTTAPVVSILSPGAGSTVSGTVAVTVRATDNTSVSQVEVYQGNTLLGQAQASGGNFVYNWNTTALSNGTQTLKARALDAAGNATTSSVITVTVNNVVTPPADTAAPSVPSGLTSSNITTTGLRISWTASTDTGGSNLAGYYVYRGAQLVGTIPAGTTVFNDSGLSASTRYNYTVRAYDNAENVSAASSSLGVTTATPPDVIAPSIPGNLRSTEQTTTAITIAWDASTDNVAVSGYKIFRNGTLVGNTTSNTTYTDTGLQSNTAYSYTVSAIDASANESAKSSALTQRTVNPADTTAPTTPSNVKVVANSATRVTVTWNASTDANGIAKYYVQRSTGGSFSTIGETASLTLVDNTAVANTNYTYRVVAVDPSNNNSSPSSTATAATPAAPTPTKPPAPEDPLCIAVSSRQINVYWTSPAQGIQKYVIKRNGTTLAQVSSTVTSYGDTSAQPSVNYTYEVIAVDSNNLESTPVTISVTAPSAKKLGDIMDRGDSRVDIFDLSALISQLNKQNPDLKSDLNGDNKVNIFDLSNLISKLGS